ALVVVSRLDAVVGQRARPENVVVRGRGDGLGRRLPAQRRRQVLVAPQRPQVDHVATLGAGLGRLVGAGLQRGKGGLGLGVERLTLEGRQLGVLGRFQHRLLGGVRSLHIAVGLHVVRRRRDRGGDVLGIVAATRPASG